MVSVLAIGFKVRMFKPGRCDGFLNKMKIRSMTSIGGEVKPSTPCRKILRQVKNPYCMKEILLVDKSHGYFSPSFSCFATRCLCWFMPESSTG
jgi:hypothetical protein